MFGLFSKSKPQTPPSVGATRVYAIGDIHGRLDLLTGLMEKITADAKNFSGAKQLIFVGDYIDRGMESRGVIDYLLTGLPAGFARIFLKGNHEDSLLRFLDGDLQVGMDWLSFGGRETLYSYGVQVGFAVGNPAMMEEVRKKLAAAMPPAQRDFFARLTLSHMVGDYYFVHAGVRPNVALTKQTAQDMMWIRNEFLFSTADFGKMIVHGHTISPEPDMKPNRIGIDTGAFATSRLTCLVLEETTQRFIST
jgi:serine/threonine protein phosphatase 1